MRNEFLKVLFVGALLVNTFPVFSQTLPVGSTVLEENYRRAQVKGDAGLSSSFSVRPLFIADFLYDSLLQTNDSLKSLYSKIAAPEKKSASFFLLPATIVQQYNTRNPFGWNDGSMIPARGYQTKITAGIYSRIGPFRIQFQPELVVAQNKNFFTFPSSHTDSTWRSYYAQANWIDAPERHGNKIYAKIFAGQSSVRFHYKKLSAGVSTENLWWGPGVRNAIVMSNNAPGFRHITINSTSPMQSRIGSFEWQVIAGILEGSDILPPDTSRTFNGRQLYQAKPDDERYINGMIVTWQPKWTKGLHVGFTRIFYQYKSNIPSSFNGYLPILTDLVKSRSQNENLFPRDQLLSVFFRLVLPESKSEVYAEYGRNDHSTDLTDFLLEPEHARAYTIGLRKIFTSQKNQEIELLGEITHLQLPGTKELRDIPVWYTHHQVVHGYTNQGQIIGAGIGPGASSQAFSVSSIKNLERIGFMIERIVHNNDFYYNAFAHLKDFGRHWVDLAFTLNKSWISKHFLCNANLSLIKAYNYQWVRNYHRYNAHATVSFSYLF